MPRKPKQPRPGMVWSHKLSRWVDRDSRTPERLAKDEAIARRVEVEAARNQESDPLSGWIRLLYKRHSASHALHSAFLLNLTREQIAEGARARPGGRDELRAFALEELASEDAGKVAYSLVVLCAVGLSEDLALIKPLLDHPSELVRRAARACRFELRRKRRSRK